MTRPLKELRNELAAFRVIVNQEHCCHDAPPFATSAKRYRSTVRLIQCLVLQRKAPPEFQNVPYRHDALKRQKKLPKVKKNCGVHALTTESSGARILRVSRKL